MSDKIITKETKQGEGIYIIEVNKEKASRVEGSNHMERINNAINEFLNEMDSQKLNPIGYKLSGQK
ncbi:MAG: hypothetical protein ACXVBR_13460 [Flavisolibacter sp.]